MEAFWAAPPVTRTLAAAACATSILVYSHLLPGSLLIFHQRYLWTFPPQIWRVFTSFLITGPSLGILLDPYFIYTYGSSIEKDSPRFSGPGDFFVYLGFVASVILFTNITLFGGMIFTQALVMALTYTYAQEKPTQKMTYFVVTFQVRWLPFVMLLMTLLMQSPEAALVQGSGLLAAHLYDFLTRLYPTFGGGQNVLQTPTFVKQWFLGSTRAKSHTRIARAHGTAFTPNPARPAPSQGSSSGLSSGLAGLTGSWRSRGAGRRLGGD